MKFEIKNRWTGKVIFTTESKNFRLAVEAAVKSNAYLQEADLQGANLQEADLQGANLQEADLQEANLQGANLRGANLQGAYLRGADLQGANLQEADLQEANLRGANLRGANLQGADLQPIRDDLWAVLSAAPNEVEGLRKALIEGRVDGSTYEGDCACLIGTIANVRGCYYGKIDGLTPNADRPSEIFFMMIKKGDIPENNQVSKIAVEWIDQWMASKESLSKERSND